jgi:zinc protease
MITKRLLIAVFFSSLSFGALATRIGAQQSEARLTNAVDKGTAAPASRPSADAPLPTPQELLNKSYDAVGGVAAWNKTTSRRMKGVYQSEDSSVFVAIEISQKSPNKSLSKITLPNGITLRDVCDGHTAWIENSARGFHEYTGAALESKLRQAEFQDPGHVDKYALTGKVTGIEKVGTHNAYVLEFAADKKTHSKLYFDADSGLIVRSEDIITTAEGPYPVKLDMDDYREVDGLKFPYRMKRTEKGAVILIRITQVTVNLPLDDTLFLKPDFAK